VGDDDELSAGGISAIRSAKRPTLDSSSGASTSSRTQKGAGWNWKMPTRSASAVRAFSPPERSRMFCSFLPGRRGDDVDAGVGGVLLVSEAHEGLAAAEELGEGDAEVLVDDLEACVELDAGDVVDLLDGGLGVLDGFEEVLALGVEEGVARGGLVVLLEGHHVDRAHGFEALLDGAGFLLFEGEGFAFDADDVG
jgi:hypothetical protein